MKVLVSCAGRFHAFNLVEQLWKRNALKSFLTTTTNAKLLPNRQLPKALANDPEFKNHLRTYPAPEYLGYFARKIPFSQSQEVSYFLKDNMYDQHMAQYIDHADLFVGWASQSLFQLREAKTRGVPTVIERGSTHIQYQRDLLDKERVKFGLKPLSGSTFTSLLEQKQLKEYHETDYIVVPSEFARQSFIGMGFPEKKIHKIRYGVDLAGFFSSERPFTDAGKPLELLFVGAIGFQKGVPYLLKSVEIVKSRGIKVNLTLIGRIEKDFEPWLATSNLRKNIDRHIAFVPNNELVQYYQAADIFCLPSIQEGLALVIAEAMACGLTPVVSENTGGSEFIQSGRNGLVIPPGDSESLATAIEHLAKDRNALAQFGRQAALDARLFSWNAYGEEVISLYKTLIEARAPNSSASSNEIENFYDDYWDRDKGWTPQHSFTDEQLKLHFAGAFQKTDAVLDVGCGDASNYEAWLVTQVRRLAAIDISPSGIANAKNMGLEATEHDFSKPFPFPDESFEGATCIEVLEHLYDPKFCVQEIFRVLKPGGLLITSVPNNGYFRERLNALTRAKLSTSITDFENEWKGAHIRFYSLHSFQRMLEVSGFEVESVRSNGEASIFDGLDAFGGYATQHFSSLLRKKLPPILRLSFLQEIWPSLFAPHIIVRARKPNTG